MATCAIIEQTLQRTLTLIFLNSVRLTCSSAFKNVFVIQLFSIKIVF